MRTTYYGSTYYGCTYYGCTYQVVAVQRETDARLTLVVQGLSRGVALRCTQVRVRGAAVRAC